MKWSIKKHYKVYIFQPKVKKSKPNPNSPPLPCIPAPPSSVPAFRPPGALHTAFINAVKCVQMRFFSGEMCAGSNSRASDIYNTTDPLSCTLAVCLTDWHAAWRGLHLESECVCVY